MYALFFDLDYTIFDWIHLYEQAISRVLRQVFDFLPEKTLDTFCKLRAKSAAFEMLGVPSITHYYETPEALALLLIFHPEATSNCIGDISQRQRESLGRFVEDLWNAVSCLPKKFNSDLVQKEVELRRMVLTNPCGRTLQQRIEDLARTDRIQDVYTQCQKTKAPVENPYFLNFVNQLSETKDLELYIASEGAEEVQKNKVSSLGVGQFFKGKVLTTEQAARPKGSSQLLESVDSLLNEAAKNKTGKLPPQLKFLYYFKQILDIYQEKGPWFFARLLHAVKSSPCDPESSLAQFAVVHLESWQRQPLKIAIVGDRYDKDIKPIITLLGKGGVLTVRIQQGKYANTFQESELEPSMRPNETFSNWDKFVQFPLNSRWSKIKPILSPLRIFNKDWINRDYLPKGLESDISIVRKIACIMTDFFDIK